MAVAEFIIAWIRLLISSLSESCILFVDVGSIVVAFAPRPGVQIFSASGMTNEGSWCLTFSVTG
jgi:hypothetical protein